MPCKPCCRSSPYSSSQSKRRCVGQLLTYTFAVSTDAIVGKKASEEEAQVRARIAQSFTHATSANTWPFRQMPRESSYSHRRGMTPALHPTRHLVASSQSTCENRTCPLRKRRVSKRQKDSGTGNMQQSYGESPCNRAHTDTKERTSDRDN